MIENIGEMEKRLEKSKFPKKNNMFNKPGTRHVVLSLASIYAHKFKVTMEEEFFFIITLQADEQTDGQTNLHKQADRQIIIGISFTCLS